MADKHDTSIPVPDNLEKAVLEALSVFLRRNNATVQLFTSARGRTWAAIRQRTPSMFVSACECAHTPDGVAIARALGHACLTHARKCTGELPLADTWTPLAEAVAGDSILARWLDSGELPEVPEEMPDDMTLPGAP